jgi:orotidine-5'-phosphate decarboxylase
MNFTDLLAQAICRCRNPIVVGLDPRWEQLPEGLRSGAAADDLAARAAAYARFCREIIDVVRGLVPAVKPQAAFFEQLGSAGMTALAEVIRYARQAGLLVIFDGKRNDIGSTAEAYADGVLGAESPWGADALTISPYLGDDSLRPFVEVARARQAGVFVLVKTSNPGGGQFQDLNCQGRPLYRHVAEYVETLAAETAGTCGYGDVGAVVGATYPEQLSELRVAMPHTWFLVPGYGSQGGTAADVARAFDQRGLGAIVNNSRGIIFAHAHKHYAGKFSATDWQRAVEAATRDMIAELNAAGISLA